MARSTPHQRPWLPHDIEILLVPSPPTFKNPECFGKVLKVVLGFARLLNFTVSIIATAAPLTLPLTLRVARQYHRTVVLEGLAWLQARHAERRTGGAQPAVSERLHMLELECESLQHTLYLDDLDGAEAGSGWVNLTIFDIAYSVIASIYICELMQDRRDRLPSEFREWADRLYQYGPFAVVFGVDQQLLGTSVPLWDGCQPLKEWQTELRSESLCGEVKTHLQEVRDILNSVRAPYKEAIKAGTANKRALVVEGQLAVAEKLGHDCLSSRLCSGMRWLSMRGSLVPLDQCSGCQVIFAGVTPVIANAPVPYKALGENFTLAWQCAESHLLYLLFRAEHELRSQAAFRQSCDAVSD